MREFSRGELSPWWPYLQLLPGDSQLASIPVFWPLSVASTGDQEKSANISLKGAQSHKKSKSGHNKQQRRDQTVSPEEQLSVLFEGTGVVERAKLQQVDSIID